MLALTPSLTHGMQVAAAAARSRLGATYPNPAVGAVALDAAGKVLATAIHHHAGGLHAETALLDACREQNLLEKIQTLCVTLEPCNHYGNTPPCTDAIIASGIKEVVVGIRDPNPHVVGGGIERLQKAGIEVLYGVDENECAWLIHAFAHKAKTGKAWVTVKRALSQDGSMIPPLNQKTFTSLPSLTLAHQLRKKADTILTSASTILADQPLFTVRHVPDYEGKKRWLAIMDRQGYVPEAYLKQAFERGFIPIIYHDFEYAFKDLAAIGAQDILVEAGPTLSAAILASDHWTMSVTIRQGDPDITDVEFSPNVTILSDGMPFKWELFLAA